MALAINVPDIAPRDKYPPRVPHRTRIAYFADYAYPPVCAFRDWELDQHIDRAREVAERLAVDVFALRLVPATRRHVYRSRGRVKVLLTGFSQAQSRLRRLWAERCRRDGVEYDDGE